MNIGLSEQEAKIDAALASYPLSPLPRGFTARVMAEVGTQAQAQPHVQPISTKRWRPHAQDLIFTIFFTIFFLSILFAIWWTIGQVAPLWLTDLQKVWQTPDTATGSELIWLPAILIAVIGCEVGLAAVWLLFWWDGVDSQPVRSFR